MLTVLALAAAVWLGLRAHRDQLAQRLLTTPPDQIEQHPDLVRFASDEARPLFAQHCAACHGADMKGIAMTGAPDLTNAVWLYGGSTYQIERDILYGIRSGQKKANDIAEMPAFGQRGQLSPAEIANIVQYLLKLNHRPFDDSAAVVGQALFSGKGACYDCHAADGTGNMDYGAPDLTANVWDYGGDPKSLYNSIYFGRHGVMPAWIGKLSPAQIRELAVYVHASARP